MTQAVMTDTLPTDIQRPPPTTPRTARNRPSPETPDAKIKSSPGNAPNSAPAATNGARRYDAKKHNEATLLSDFFQGKQTASRVAANRRRRKSLDAVKAELRREMKQDSVRKLQQPGHVRERVQAWQRNNQSALTDANPNDAATEPDDVAFDGQDLDSVTEEDRLRIKLRRKKDASLPKFLPNGLKHAENSAPSAARDHHVTADDAKSSTSPPKKRVVSDSNWMRRHKPKKSTSPKFSSSAHKSSTSPQTPKPFVLYPTPNPPVSSKIKAWAAKLETPDEYESGSQVGGSAASRASRPKQRNESCRRHVTRLADSKDIIACHDGIRVTGSKDSIVRDDGIRVRPTTTGSDIFFSGSKYQPSHQNRSKSLALSSRSTPSDETSQVSTPYSAGTSKPVRRRSKSMSNPTGESKSSYTLSKSRSIKTSSVKRNAAQSTLSNSTPETDASSRLGDETSDLSTTFRPESDLNSSITAKTLADIPGDIPFGHSAFSELDLTAGGVGRYRPKRLHVERKSSFKGMPHVLKKVMEEGKKIMKDIHEPPRSQAPNKPPSIEKWLSTTVEPFVEAAAEEAPAAAIEKKHHARNDKAVEEDSTMLGTSDSSLHRQPSTEVAATDSGNKDVKSLNGDMDKKSITSRRRRTHSTGIKQSAKQELAVEDASKLSTALTEKTCAEEAEKSPEAAKETVREAVEEMKKEVVKETDAKNKSPIGLQRTKARRSVTSSPKDNKKDFLGMFKNAFSGESNASTGSPKARKTEEPRRIELTDDVFNDVDYTDGSALSRDADSLPTDSTCSTQQSSPPKMSGFRPPPPTNGHHELSTIVSDDGSSSAAGSALTGSDATSRATQSTLTDSTILSKPNQLFFKKRSSLTKNRLTSQSDLMSVLSLPDQAAVPQGMKHRSRPSLRRRKGVPAGFTADDLLKEFAQDEDLYSRELKTLVDGVIPVLLSDVVKNNSDTAALFSSGGGTQADAISKAVVGMGVALEKIRNAHKKAPVHDIRRLAKWAHGVVSMYNSYLSAWRLGFQDLIVNLAPAADRPDDDDSLLDALPRDDNGDVINAKGERVAVAYLLKRPLVRIKHMVKLIKCIDSLVYSVDTSQLLRDFEGLLEKSRRRHREETARIEDEDAINTNLTGCRDVRTLAAVMSPVIDASLQVNAKDTFSLSFAHSSGQRLDCQVELVYRDNPLKPEHEGDLLIRDPGNPRQNKKPTLLFPPIPMHLCSARTGDGNFDMVIMLRGTHENRPWHELLPLTADDEDQILDWLDLLPLSPVPPREPEPSVIGHDKLESARNVSVGAAQPVVPSDARPARTVRTQSPLFKASDRHTTPTESQHKAVRNEAPQASSADSDNDKTPTQPRFKVMDWDDGSYLEHDLILPEPLNIKKSYPTKQVTDKKAPFSPVHRKLAPTAADPKMDSDLLSPPDNGDGVRRRRSSPLKHEYLPSDVSSASSSPSPSPSPEQSEDESSDDDIDSMDIPETELGFSIAKDQAASALPKTESVLSQSSCSVTPSNSASQAYGIYAPRIARKEHDNTTRYMATLSRWSDRGVWKDIANHACTIIVSAGLIEAYAFRQDSGQGKIRVEEQPVIALDLTPLVLIRQSTGLDLEVRSCVQMHSLLYETYKGGNFRFRCQSASECFALYMAVHHARLSNQKFIQLANEARFKSFGERREGEADDRSGRRRSWFGRKNSYRSAPRGSGRSQEGESAAHSSTPSAMSFLKRLTQSGSAAFNLEHSSIDRQGRSSGSGQNSFYTSGSSSASGDAVSPRSPRSPSVSTGYAAARLGGGPMDAENICIRLHLLISPTKWEDCGNCILKIQRPPPGWRQALLADHGLEKRITVQSLPKKEGEACRVFLDAVLGSGCFSAMGSRGIVCGIWEEVSGEDGVVGALPVNSSPGGKIKKWCFQLSTVAEANWVLQLVHQEVVRV